VFYRLPGDEEAKKALTPGGKSGEVLVGFFQGEGTADER
jgi:hypothetical protein